MNVRVIAATHRRLEERVAAGTFREDLLTGLKFPHLHCAAARAGRGHPAPGPAVRGGILRGFGKPAEEITPREHGGAAAALVAGEHPRAAQRRGAGDGRGEGPRLTIPSRRRLSSATSRSASSQMSRRITSGRCSRAWAGESADWAGRRTGSGLRPTTLETRMAKLGLAGRSHRFRWQCEALKGFLVVARLRRKLTAEYSRGAELELQASLGRQLQVFLARSQTSTAPVAPPTAAPMAAPSPPPAMPPTIAPSPAPPATLRAVFFPSP